ncbi:septal ring lytic transglycosylase RlpA family protein [Psychromonas sp. MME2]|uniref:septal ring lytic transglycosylase RlpA family protein n=1 Tax=unclassified Psychromonas TaxID=2614957 RepID=UPI00339C2B87
MRRFNFTILLIALSSLLISCSSSNNRYKIKDDHKPAEIPPLAHVEDATPRYEPYSRGGNSDYTVRGIKYKVLKNISEFNESGKASWYGKKFHGHLTSNGERYNMFAMSAAHKNLPLPSYVKVTNLKNNKQVIVRVNDRGPFHEGRIIDLSYAAADKLDMLNAGTADVAITLLHFPQEENLEDHIGEEFYVQYLVTSQQDKAQQQGQKNAQLYQAKHQIIEGDNKYKLRLGPFNSALKAQEILKKIRVVHPSAFIIKQKQP